MLIGLQNRGPIVSLFERGTVNIRSWMSLGGRCILGDSLMCSCGLHNTIYMVIHSELVGLVVNGASLINIYRP